MLRIILIRHPKPLIDKGICYGQSDISTDKNFPSAVLDTQKRLKHLGITPESKSISIYSSPLKRCLLLSKKLKNWLKTPDIQIDKRLIELNFGDWEMKKWADIERSPEYSNWSINYSTESPPNGESLSELEARFIKFYQMLKQHHNVSINSPEITEDVLIVTHQSIIRLFLADILAIPYKNIFSLKFDFGSTSEIQLDRKITNIISLNH